MSDLEILFVDLRRRQAYLRPQRTTELSLWRWYRSERQAELALAAAAEACGWAKIKLED